MASEQETRERRVETPPFAAPRVFVLAAMAGPDPQRVHRIDRPETIVGRGEDADLRLEDDEVSQRHCLLRVDGGRCHLVDLESRNGTIVNSRPLPAPRSERLRHLDEIQLGRTRFVFLAAICKGG
jgi:pSer/pThr/pTyr-binding forkhead associated (FHA) protein